MLPKERRLIEKSSKMKNEIKERKREMEREQTCDASLRRCGQSDESL